MFSTPIAPDGNKSNIGRNTQWFEQQAADETQVRGVLSDRLILPRRELFTCQDRTVYLTTTTTTTKLGWVGGFYVDIVTNIKA